MLAPRRYDDSQRHDEKGATWMIPCILKKASSVFKLKH
ncbi:hypothetical protein WANA31_0180 [Wolbachia endosymbiont of Drosophila ananassae]|nr:hypothetical protein WANA31_0180 [Wolbachia endosymbiont of Drosophila ananassae]RLT62028.1 hypothetical protein WANA34_1350 [Wolbachia endosymbiont of Drosophila ananassae]